ncbi:MAG TPA: membrane protein insertase YidC [Candidatus Aquilonibacter sp.]|nr:membrane protein insertase YidC [Candidatus Aquilonibacter sp.]
MSDQTRAAVFFVIAVGIFILWSHFFMPASPTPSQSAQKAQTSQAVSTSTTQATAQAVPAVPSVPATIQAVQAKAENTVTVGSSLYDVELSNRGGVVRSWRLEKYLNDQKPPQPLDLVNADSSQELGWPLSLYLSDPNLESEANSGLYQITPSAGPLKAPAQVTMQWSNGHLSVTKKLDFTKTYDTDLDVSVTLDGKPIPFAVAWRGEFGDKDVYQSVLLNVFYDENGKLNLEAYKNLGNPSNRIEPAERAGPMDYAGIQDQFFAAAFIPRGNTTGLALWDWTQWHHYVENNQNQSEPLPQMAAGPVTPGPLSARLFVGPKDLQVLAQQTPSLEGLVQFGWTAFIAKPLLLILEWMHKYIPNYGWVIVVFTILLNTLLFPVKMYSFKSARKMQLVAPEIKAIQDRYKKYAMRDPRKQKMNEEVMAVYSREGINPASGCLPMLPQIIILWAFYRVLEYSIVLRHEPWIWWIHDLSARDPYYIIPAAMAVTSFTMQKMTPMPVTTDPAQRRMMMLMPLAFVLFLFRYAAGLNLYYFLSNLVGTGQQWYLNRTQPLPSRSKFKKSRNE